MTRYMIFPIDYITMPNTSKPKGKSTYRPRKNTYSRKYRSKYYAGAKSAAVDNDNATFMINRPNKIMTFSRNIIRAATITDPAVGTTQAYAFVTKLEDYPNYAEFQALFQKYRIKYFKVRIRGTDLNGDSNVQPTIYMWKNQDSSLIASTIDKDYVAQLANVKCLQVDNTRRVIELVIRPYFLNQNFAGLTAGYTQTSNRSDWLDTAYADVEYYSIGVFVENLTPGGTGVTIDVDFEAVFEFKQYQ